jgi:nucleotide-binding universal stress UspA family protein
MIVGVDGSPVSKVAVDWAARDAALRNIPLTVFHVLTPPTLMTSTPPTATTWPDVPLPSSVKQWQEAQGHRILRAALKVVEDSAQAGRP